MLRLKPSNKKVGCWCKDPSSHFHCASRFNRPCTRTYLRLLGPCFKTGRKKPFHHTIVQRGRPHKAAPAISRSTTSAIHHHTMGDSQGKSHLATIDALAEIQTTRASHCYQTISPRHIWFHPLPFQRFQIR